MNKKGIVVIGPALVLINFFAFIISAIKTLLAFGLGSSLIFHKKIRHDKKFMLNIIEIVMLIFIIMSLIILGYKGEHHTLALILGVIPFAITLIIFNYNNLKKEKSKTIKTIAALCAIYIILSQITLLITLR